MSYQHLVAGLDALHLITEDFKLPILRVDLEDFSGNTAYAEYRWGWERTVSMSCCC